MDEQASPALLGTLSIDGAWNWDAVLAGPKRQMLAAAIAAVLPQRRWFGSKTRQIRGLEIIEAVPLGELARLLIVRVHFESGGAEFYQIPLAYVANGSEASIRVDGRWLAVDGAEGRVDGVLYDALGDPEVCRLLLAQFDQSQAILGQHGQVRFEHSLAYDQVRGERGAPLRPKLVQAEQSNTSIIYGDRLILKFFRRIEQGLNPDWEISEVLTRFGFRGTPAMAGAIAYRQTDDDLWVLALLQAFVPNRGDAWKFTLDWLEPALAEFLARGDSQSVPALPSSIVSAATQPIPAEVRTAFGGFLTSVEQLARRTGEMHLTLASDEREPGFEPEPFTEADRRGFLERAGDYARQTWALLRDKQPELTGNVAEQAQRVGQLEAAVQRRYQGLADRPLQIDKIRIHGDYHLGQVLATGDDFAIIDFEGEPVRSIDERRQKQLALRDVAGMIRSLHYASHTAASTALQSAGRDQQPAIEAWTRSWYAWSSVAFLRSYRETVGQPAFLPASLEEFQQLLEACLLEKAVYELRYELNNRPDWVYLPLAALEELLT